MDTSSGTVELRLEDRPGGRVAFVTICNEARRNALGSTLMVALVETFKKLAADETLRIVVLRGAGDKAFIGGADIFEMAGLDKTKAEAFIRRLHEACQAIRDLSVPVIARISGVALGGGMEVAAACDMRVAARSARFGMPEVRLGMPSVIEEALLPGLIGWGRTRRLLLLGDLISAEEAAAWGFVDRLVEDSGLDAATDEWIEAALQAGPSALRLQKALLRRREQLPLAFQAAFDGGEPQRLTRAYVERRRRR